MALSITWSFNYMRPKPIQFNESTQERGNECMFVRVGLNEIACRYIRNESPEFLEEEFAWDWKIYRDDTLPIKGEHRYVCQDTLILFQ